MPLVKNGQVVEDSFVRIPDDAPIPDDVAALIPAARLLADADAVLGRAGPTGVLWSNDQSVAALTPHLDRLALIALVFPNFRDGRAYTQARLLRERYHFRGQLRATGQVLRDQFVFMHRAGFDAFEINKLSDADAFAKTIARYTMVYQLAADRQSPAFLRRRQAVSGQQEIAHERVR